MYALLNSEGQIQLYPYSISQLQADNPGTSFPSPMPDERLADWNVVVVVATTQPTVPPKQNVTEGTPAETDGVWYQTWVVTDKTPEQISEYNESQKQSRLIAYEQKSDPVFFKWQRGEATQQDWVDSVTLVKQQYLYIEV